MASIRQIKKNLNYLTQELINECLAFQYFNQNADVNKVDEAISEIIENHNDLIHRINHFNVKGDRKKIKAYFKSIKEDFKKSIEALNKLGSN